MEYQSPCPIHSVNALSRGRECIARTNRQILYRIDHMNGGAFRPILWTIILTSSAERSISASNASKRLLTKRVYNKALRDAILLRTISPRPGDFKTSLSDVHSHSIIHTTHEIVAEPLRLLSLLRGRRITRFPGPTHQSLYRGGYDDNRKQHTLSKLPTAPQGV